MDEVKTSLMTWGIICGVIAFCSTAYFTESWWNTRIRAASTPFYHHNLTYLVKIVIVFIAAREIHCHSHSSTPLLSLTTETIG